MKKIIAYLFIFLLSSGNVFAQTILQALKEAYNNNVELNAERENLIVSEQDLKISKSEYLPSATITSSKSQENTKKLTNQSGGDATINDVDPLSTAIKIEQTLIDLGRSADNQKKKSENSKIYSDYLFLKKRSNQIKEKERTCTSKRTRI